MIMYLSKVVYSDEAKFHMSGIVKGKVILLHALEALGVRGGFAPTHS
jgi:hypothetical protein